MNQWDLLPYKSRKTNNRGYTSHWKRLSKSILKQEPQCRSCGRSESVLVHHLDGDTSNNAQQNLIPLCEPCHGRMHAKPYNEMIYLMSDLAVSSIVPKLSKLVLLCLLSSEVWDNLLQRLVSDFRFVGTTAFSPHPASMKYRGVFKLHSRKKTNEGYLLNYIAPLGTHSLQKGFQLWLKKYNN